MRLGLLEKQRRRESGANIHAGDPAGEHICPKYGTAALARTSIQFGILAGPFVKNECRSWSQPPTLGPA